MTFLTTELAKELDYFYILISLDYINIFFHSLNRDVSLLGIFVKQYK
jgi:hypothetical protein